MNTRMLTKFHFYSISCWRVTVRFISQHFLRNQYAKIWNYRRWLSPFSKGFLKIYYYFPNFVVASLALQMWRNVQYCVKGVRILGYSVPYFLAFVLNVERYGFSFRIQSACRKLWTRINPSMGTFHAVQFSTISIEFSWQHILNHKC